MKIISFIDLCHTRNISQNFRVVTTIASAERTMRKSDEKIVIIFPSPYPHVDVIFCVEMFALSYSHNTNISLNISYKKEDKIQQQELGRRRCE